MDRLETYRQIIEKIFNEYAKIPYAYGDIQKQVILDYHADHYLLVAIGWDGVKRVYGTIFHIDIINEKLWIQRDGSEHGIAEELVTAGIPRDQIVLGFRSPELRQYTEYAAA